MTKTGLVLEGGGMRGIYTAGVLDVFMEHGITFDGVIGVSAGAIHGCSYLSNQHGRSIRYYKKYCKDRRFMSIWSFLTTGNVVGVDFCYHELPDKLDLYDHDAFLKSKTPFYVTVTNVETGEAEYLLITDMKGQIDSLRASASLPYLSKVVEIGGKKYLDGGCTDSIPVEAFRQMGYARNVLILTRPADHVRKPEHPKLAKLWYRKYPKLAKALRDHHERYNQTVRKLAEYERDGSVFVIRPKEHLNIGRLEKDPENVQRVYGIGRADGEAALERLALWKGRQAGEENLP